MKRSLVPPAGREPIQPKNPEQKIYMEALWKSTQVFAVGKAGTGKTFLPSCVAADHLLRDNGIDSFIMCRPAVGVGGEKHGFLPGKIEQKVAPWMLPIVDVLEERLGAENVKRLIASGDVRSENFEHMRGRTFKNSFILLDEAQNTTVEQMKCFLTRTGTGSRLVVCGDTSQTDIIGKENGLAFALRTIAQKRLDVPVIKLIKTERSGESAMWANAFDM